MRARVGVMSQGAIESQRETGRDPVENQRESVKASERASESQKEPEEARVGVTIIH